MHLTVRVKIVWILYILTAFESEVLVAAYKDTISGKKHLRIYTDIDTVYSVANAKCQEVDSRLVEITEKSINDDIKTAIQDFNDETQYFLTGGTDQKTEGTWKWNNRTNFSFTSWTYKEPNGGTRENCLFIRYFNPNKLEWVDTSCESDNGNLKFGYICEQVEASINNLSFTTVNVGTSGETKQTCQANGFPDPTVVWKKNGADVSNQPTSMPVYQTISRRKSVLHFGNAMISDEGIYKCRANNTIWGVSKEIWKNFTLKVPGAPTIVKTDADLCKPEITVEWQPNSRALNHKHKIAAMLNGKEVSLHEETPNAAGPMKTTLQQNLIDSTTYTIKVSACTATDCKPENERTQNETTGGKPNAVTGLSLTKANTTHCMASWSPPLVGRTITQYRIAVKSSIVKVTPRTVNQTISSEPPVNVSDGKISFATLPNRDYTVEVSAVVCGVLGPVQSASGSCTTDVAAPTSVPAVAEPVISNGDVTIKLPTVDESYGPISCIFVMMKKGSLSYNTSRFRLNELNNASTSSGSDGKLFIAFAELPERMGTSLTFGETTPGSCNIQSLPTSFRKKRATDTLSKYTGQSVSLQVGESYSIFPVTTTPASGSVLFQSGKVTVFKNEAQGSSMKWWYILMIVALLILITIVVLLIWKRKKFQAHSQEVDEPSVISDAVLYRNNGSNAEQVQTNAVVYENVRPTAEQIHRRSETDIAMKDFEEIYKSMVNTGNEGFQREFEDLILKAKLHTGSVKAASAPDMKKKNRYKNILPYDNTRVVLQHTSSGYINACYINGFEQEHKFIACQGPLPATIGDFWQMVFEQECQIIVMLTKCEENGKNECTQYWPNTDETLDLKTLSVSIEEEANYGRYLKRKITLKTKLGAGVPLTVFQYQFLAWPDHKIPTTTSNLMRMHNAVMEQHSNNGKKSPIVVHCSDGVGRTAALIGYDILLQEMNAYNRVDVFNCVLKLRAQRMEMIQTLDQYVLVHKLVLEAYLFGNTELPAKGLKNVLQKSQHGSSLKLANEFIELSRTTPMQNQKVIGSEAANRRKNRYQECVPYDHSIVQLESKSADSTPAYFNGSWIETYDEAVHMIATQGPLNSDESMNDFWHAVIDNNVSVIVMLTGLSENNVEQCAQYWPADIGRDIVLGDITVTLVEDIQTSFIVRRMIQVKWENNKRMVQQHQYLDWKENSCPRDATEILTLITALINTMRDSKEEHVLVHCSNGAGRTGAFCAIVNLIERMKAENRVDVFRAVKDLRDCRPGMVQTSEQYSFCYEAVLSYLSNCQLYENYIPANEQSNPLYEKII